MAAIDPEKSHIPGIFGGDLPENEQTAFEESHDADFPHSESDSAAKQEVKSLKKDVAVETEKAEKPASSNSSEDGSPVGRDLEKGEAEINISEESKEPPDPNVVDWDGPEDPENPQNWYGVLHTELCFRNVVELKSLLIFS